MTIDVIPSLTPSTHLLCFLCFGPLRVIRHTRRTLANPVQPWLWMQYISYVYFCPLCNQREIRLGGSKFAAEMSFMSGRMEALLSACGMRDSKWSKKSDSHSNIVILMDLYGHSFMILVYTYSRLYSENLQH